MNNTRRKQLRKLAEQIAIETDEINDLISEEEEYKDNMPENLQETDRYYDSETAVDAMTEVANLLSEATDKLQEIE